MGITRRRVIAIAVGALASVALSGCDGDGRFNLAESLNLGGQNEDTQDGASARSRPSGEDVEAPEAFSVSAEGLWDGRPSLGGIWVAHPDVSQPERVVIRNPSNGNEVVGALFRRERDTPGPPFQVSSDAAKSLGMLAGEPGELDVTALRRAEGPDDAPPAENTLGLEAEEEVTETTLDPAVNADDAMPSDAD